MWIGQHDGEIVIGRGECTVTARGGVGVYTRVHRSVSAAFVHIGPLFYSVR